MAVTSWKYILKVLNKRDLRVCEWEVRHGMVMSFLKTQRCLWRWSQQPAGGREKRHRCWWRLAGHQQGLLRVGLRLLEGYAELDHLEDGLPAALLPRSGENHLRKIGDVFFFGLVAAWVSPGRSALQSAKQRCYVRNGHNHKMMSYIIKTLSKTCNKAKKPSAYPREAEAKKQDRVYKTRALVKSRRKAPTPEQEVRIFFFLHCRASAKHSRSTTGNMKWTGANWVQNFHKTIPKTKQTNTNQNRTQPTKPTKTNPQGPVKFRKKMWDKGETTCPSQPLMRSLPPCSNPPCHPCNF